MIESPIKNANTIPIIPRKTPILLIKTLFPISMSYVFFKCWVTFMCKERCVFECEDFPKENQMQANKATIKRLN